MQLTATFKHVIDTQTGQGRNGEWTKTSCLFKIPGQYPKDLAVDFWKPVNLIAGESYELHLDVSSREYNGKWYTDVKAWKWNGNEMTKPKAPAQPVPNRDFQGDPDLPFSWLLPMLITLSAAGGMI